MKSNISINTSINATTLNNIQPRPTTTPLQQQLLQQQQSFSLASQQQQNIQNSTQQPQQGTRTPTTLQIPSDCMVIKNEQGQLVLVQTNSSAARNPLICNTILPLQQSVTTTHRSVTPLTQNSNVGSLSSNSSTIVSSSSRPVLIQNQSMQQPLQRFTILPPQQQQQLNRLPLNQSTTSNIITSPLITTNSSLLTAITTNTKSANPASNIQSDHQTTDQKEVIENVKKCKNFLSTLLKLASNQPIDTLNRVMKLIQGLIDDVVTPEEFTGQLQQQLKSSPQPYLIPFLRKSLPYLRKFMVKNKSMTIDGIKPPTIVNVTSNNLLDTSTTTTTAITTLNNVTNIYTSNNVANNVINNFNDSSNTSNSHTNSSSNFQASNKVLSNPIPLRPHIRPTISQQQTNTTQHLIQQQQLKSPATIASNNATIVSSNVALSSSDNNLVNMVASSSSSNLEAFKQNLQQQQQQSVMAALHTSKNFIAPTTPLPSSLPRLILSSNSTLLTSLQHQPQFNNLSSTTSAANNLPSVVTTTSTIQASNTLFDNKILGINTTLIQQHQQPNKNKLPSMLLKNPPGTTTTLQGNQAEKRKFDSVRDDNDDLNDVAAMGGVNLSEETRNFSNPVLISGQTFGQTRSFNDEIPLWEAQLLQALVNRIAQKKGLSHVHPDCVKLLSHAVKYKLTAVLEQLSIISEHRSEIYKNESKMEVCTEVKRQLKFRQELAKLEDDKAKEVKNLALMKAAKSRTKTDDPDQLKRKELAKKQQQEDMDAKRKEQSDLTALAAIGSKKKLNLSQKISLMNGHHTNNSLANQGNTSLFNISGLSHAGQILSQRSRRANLKDLIHILQQDPQYNRSSVLYRALIKY